MRDELLSLVYLYGLIVAELLQFMVLDLEDFVRGYAEFFFQFRDDVFTARNLLRISVKVHCDDAVVPLGRMFVARHAVVMLCVMRFHALVL